MSDVVVSVVESTTNVIVTEPTVAVDVTETSVDVSSSTAGIQGASYAKGDPIYEYVRNSTGTTLLKGQIVYLSGATGNHVNVSLAQASGDSTSARTIGWISENIANNAQGYVMMFGYLEGIDTSAANAVGDILYLSPTVAGGWTSTKPYAPNHLVYVGVCVRKNPSNGAVSVHIQNGYELDEIHDVQITSKADGDLLRYESSTDLWKNKAASTLTLAQSQITNLVSDLAGKAALGSANAFTVGGHTITNNAVGTIPFTITGASGQTGNLFSVRSSASELAFISAGGNINAFQQVRVGGSSGLGQLSVTSGAAGTIGAVIRGAASQSANLQEWQSSAGSTAAYVASNGDIYARVSRSTVAARFQTNDPTIAVQVNTGASSQTADTMQYQNAAGTILGGRNAVGQAWTGSTTTLKTAVGGTIQSIATGANPLVTMASAHNLAVGDLVTLASTTSGTYDGTFVIATVPATTTFTITSSLTAGQAGAAGTVSVPAQKSITARSAGTIGVVIRAVASQVANLQEWQNSGGGVLGYVNSSGVGRFEQVQINSGYASLAYSSSGGSLRLVKKTAAQTNIGAGIGDIYFRDGTNAGTLKLVVRAGAAGAETTILDNIPQ